MGIYDNTGQKLLVSLPDNKPVSGVLSGQILLYRRGFDGQEATISRRITVLQQPQAFEAEVEQLLAEKLAQEIRDNPEDSKVLMHKLESLLHLQAQGKHPQEKTYTETVLLKKRQLVQLPWTSLGTKALMFLDQPLQQAKEVPRPPPGRSQQTGQGAGQGKTKGLPGPRQNPPPLDPVVPNGWFVRGTGVRDQADKKISSQAMAVTTDLFFIGQQDSENTTIKVYSYSGSVARFKRELSPPEDQALDHPFEARAIAVNKDAVFVADCANSCIWKFGLHDGGFLARFGQKGHNKGDLHHPEDIAVAGENVFVADSNNRISVYSLDGKFDRTFGDTGKKDEEKLSTPISVDVSGDEVFVNDPNKGRIAVYQRTGEYVRDIPLADRITSKIAVVDDSIFVLDLRFGQVFVCNKSDGTFLRKVENPDRHELLMSDVVVFEGKLFVYGNRNSEVLIFT